MEDANETNETAERIVRGAVGALGRYGMRKFSMSDISVEAGVSRGTLYRYFKNKDDVLNAVGAHVERSLRSTLQGAIDAHPEPERRLEVVLSAMMDYRKEYPETTRLVEAEAGFALGVLTSEFPILLAIVAEALDPVLEAAPPVRAGVMRKRQLAEIFLRVVISTFLVPSPGSDRTTQRLVAMWTSMAASRDDTQGSTRRVAG